MSSAETIVGASRGRSISVPRLVNQACAACLLLFAVEQPLTIAGEEIAYSLAALLWVVECVWTRRIDKKKSPLDLIILIYLVLCAVSTLLSPLPASSWEGMRKIGLIFLVLVVAHNVRSARQTRQILTL